MILNFKIRTKKQREYWVRKDETNENAGSIQRDRGIRSWSGVVQFIPEAFCEIDRAAQQVLSRFWPAVELSQDITQFSAKHLRSIDLLCGGFPCQDISKAGRGGGLDGSRSGLWWEMRRVIDETRPRWLLIENVSALRVRGADALLSSLEELGYTCWPLVVGAWAVGAGHIRDRVWIVAYLNGDKLREQSASEKSWIFRQKEAQFAGAFEAEEQFYADAKSTGLQKHRITEVQEIARSFSGPQFPAREGRQPHEWEPASLVGRALNPEWAELFMGFPVGWTFGLSRAQRVKALGNAVVPWVVAVIGAAIAVIDNLLDE